MRRSFLMALLVFVIFGLIFGLARRASAQTNILGLRMPSVMTAKELKETGVADLTAPQRKALDDWLNRYTETIIKVTVEAKGLGSPEDNAAGSSSCLPADGCR